MIAILKKVFDLEYDRSVKEAIVFYGGYAILLYGCSLLIQEIVWLGVKVSVDAYHIFALQAASSFLFDMLYYFTVYKIDQLFIITALSLSVLIKKKLHTHLLLVAAVVILSIITTPYNPFIALLIPSYLTTLQKKI